MVLRANLFIISTLICAVAACALAATASARSRIDEIDYSQRYAAATRKRAVVDFIGITIDFRQHKLTLYRHNIIYGSHDSGMDTKRINRTAMLTPQIEHQIMDAMYTAHALDLAAIPHLDNQPQRRGGARFSGHRSTNCLAAQCKIRQSKPSVLSKWANRNTPPFSPPGLGLDGKLIIRKTMISVLKQLKVDMTAKPDELVTEEGDQFEPIKTNLKDVLDHSDNYRGKRVSVTGWPVADGRELIGLSLQKSTTPGNQNTWRSIITFPVSPTKAKSNLTSTAASPSTASSPAGATPRTPSSSAPPASNPPHPASTPPPVGQAAALTSRGNDATCYT